MFPTSNIETKSTRGRSQCAMVLYIHSWTFLIILMLLLPSSLELASTPH